MRKQLELGKNCINYILNIITVEGERAGHVSRIAGKDFLRKLEGEGPLGAPKYRWDTYIKINFKGFSWKYASLIRLVQYEDRWHFLVGTVMNIWYFSTI
jgi:hypothetical protein